MTHPRHLSARPLAYIGRQTLRHLADRELLALPYNDRYRDFTFGTWRNCVLWNETGDSADSAFRSYDGAGAPTELLRGLPALADFVAEAFDARHLRWMRLFLLTRGWLLPHRDFLDTGGASTRIHLPLMADASCLHSENNFVYRMAPGQLWWIDASQVHSACATSQVSRVTLCLDFSPEIPFDRLVRLPAEVPQRPAPIERPPLPEVVKCRFSHKLRSCAGDDEFSAVVRDLSCLHFGYALHAAEMYDWLMDFTVDNPALHERSIALARQALGTERLVRKPPNF